MHLATAELRSLSLYRNGTKAGVIPRNKLSTKISGLALDTEYTFHLVLRTSAGQYSSERLAIKTHKMTDLTGITVSPGVMPSQLKDSLAEAVNRIGAKMIDSVRIDTTHFVCTEPRGQNWEKAVEMNVPVVVPDWVLGCEREGRIVGVRGYYLDADPKLRQIGPSPQILAAQRLNSSQSQQAMQSPRIEHTPPTPERATHEPEPEPTPSAATEPPTPPPKAAATETSGERDGESIAGTTVVAKDFGGADDDDSENDEHEAEGLEDKGKGKAADREPEDAADDASELETPGGDEKFDEVALY